MDRRQDTGLPEGDSARTDPRQDDIVRVISMGSGAFDTAIQLGVTHALLVIQGRAPDAVVGLSAGCVNAVALAEVLQAGEPVAGRGDADESGPAPPPSPGDIRSRHRRRMGARVQRFRKILDRLVRVPREFMEGLLPDAYQVDSREPLQTVEAPIFLEDERQRRNEAVANRAGLVRLYNDLLGLGLSFGTITQAIRRGLGIAAAGEIRSPVARSALRLVEALRLWILAGVNLVPISRLVPFVLVPPARSWLTDRWNRLLDAMPRRTGERRPRGPGLSAGAIIFRFPGLEAAGRGARAVVVFVVVLTVWVTLSLGAVLLPYFAAGRMSFLTSEQAYAWALALLVALSVLVGPKLVEFDRTTFPRLAYDTLKSLIVAGGLVAFWGACVVLILTVVRAFLFAAEGGGLGGGALGTGFDQATRQLADAVVWGARAALLIVAAFLLLWVGRDRPLPGLRSSYMRRFLRAILRRYEVERSIFSTYLLERLFSDLFDEGYWGQVPIEGVVGRSLDDRASGPSQGLRDPKRLSHYSEQEPPIHVGVTAANLDTGRLEVMSPSVPVVRSLVAGLSVVPFFPPTSLDGQYYVDGANVTSEALDGVFALLKHRGALPRKGAVHIYPVMTLPVSRPTLSEASVSDPAPEPDAPYVSLVDVTTRALRLQRFRDATLERRLTELYTQVLPTGKTRLTVDLEADGKRTYVRSWVTPVEPPAPVGLNQRVLQAPPDESRRMMLETVSDGCRAALQVMTGPSQRHPEGCISCRTAVEAHLKARADEARKQGNPAVAEVAGLRLPGSEDSGGPGLATICDHCALVRDRSGAPKGSRRTLSFEQEWKEMGAPWPHELETAGGTDPEGRFVAQSEGDGARATRRALKKLRRDVATAGHAWPRLENGEVPRPLSELPVRSLLFSGGVFRGVFQMGSIAALSELGLRPDLVAGASVGSITAAMTATVLTERDHALRRRRVARLASVYLSLDQLILTDRFADFVRNLTVRAGDARFSISQADRVFRRFDARGMFSYGSDVRRVLAGLERVFYLNPFEVTRLVEAVRNRQRHEVLAQLRSHAHEWLQRMNAEEEVLGAEPLQRLIRHYVLGETVGENQGASDPTFEEFRTRLGIQFLVTATNLHDGRLEILGIPSDDPRRHTSLVEGLLASSAFPGVFRPRYAHELRSSESRASQYIDGGTMDNLPVDAVAEFLIAAAPEDHEGHPTSQALIHRRPRRNGRPIPHLVFAASLEVTPRSNGRNVGDLSWPELLKRTRQLGYNRKLDQYQHTQEGVRAIYNASRDEPRALNPLDLELVVVKPRWLCGTLAFHPMLGFRRRRQAQSIAHGCASTLVAFSRHAGENREYAEGWGIKSHLLPRQTELDAAVADLEHDGVDTSCGQCWLSPDITCPFSRVATGTSMGGVSEAPQGPAGKAHALPEATRDALHQIYRECIRPATHGL